MNRLLTKVHPALLLLAEDALDRSVGNGIRFICIHDHRLNPFKYFQFLKLRGEDGDVIVRSTRLTFYFHYINTTKY